MKNKKGFLLAEETLKIILAVIGIGFLVYLLAALYYTNKNAKDLELAEASLNHLVDEINSMNEGETKEVEIYNPKYSFRSSWWTLAVFSNTNEFKPDSCLNLGWENCICICGVYSVKEKSKVKDCDNNGVCLELEKKFYFLGGDGEYAFELKDLPLILEIDKDRGEISKK
jgi:hypothetical protein